MIGAGKGYLLRNIREFERDFKMGSMCITWGEGNVTISGVTCETQLGIRGIKLFAVHLTYALYFAETIQSAV